MSKLQACTYISLRHQKGEGAHSRRGGSVPPSNSGDSTTNAVKLWLKHQVALMRLPLQKMLLVADHAAAAARFRIHWGRGSIA